MEIKESNNPHEAGASSDQKAAQAGFEPEARLWH